MVTSYFETKRQLNCGDLLFRKQNFWIFWPFKNESEILLKSEVMFSF
jgi:hypothetical protein